jgi:c-di-GMP-binding flagellar brake protein YcgR
MTSCIPDLLDRVLAGRLPGTLAVASDPRQQWQVKFLARDAINDGVWVEPMGEAQRPLDPIIARGAAVEVAFCLNHARYAFQTQIVRRNKHFWLNALLLMGPVELYPAERRAHPRFQVPDGSQIFAQVTCPGALFPVNVKPWDLSAGGISFMSPRENGVMALKAGNVIDLKLAYRGRPISAKASVRFSRFITERVIKTGAQFVPDAMDAVASENLEFFLTDMARLVRPDLAHGSR